MESADFHRQEVLSRATLMVQEMEKIAQEETPLPPGKFSIASIGIEDRKIQLMPRFAQLFNACGHDPDLQQDILRIVRESKLSINDRAKLHPLLGLK